MVGLNRASLEESIRNNQIITARFLAEKIDDYIESLSGKLLFIIDSQDAGLLDYRGKQLLVRAFVSSSEDLISVAMVNSSGEEFIKTYHPDYSEEAKIGNISSDPLFSEAAYGPAVSGVYRVSEEPRMDIIYPLGREYIYITVSLDKLWTVIRSGSSGRESATLLIDPEGEVLAHTRPSLEGKIMDIPPVKALLNRSSTGSMEYEDAGERMVGAYSPVESMGWGVLTSQPYRYAFESSIKMRRDAYLWIIGVLIGCLILSGFLAKSLTRPILKMADAAGAISSGDFERRVEIRSGDELEELASAFNGMSASLKKYSEMQIDRIIAEKTKTSAIIFSIEDGIVMTDEEGRILLYNERALELMNITGEPEEGEPIFNYIEDPAMKEAMMTSAAESEIETVSSGERRVIRSIAGEVETEAGRNIGKMKVLRDITFEKELEEMKERFLHSVTHDLKNPLSAVISISDLLKALRGEDLTEDEKKYFSILKEESGRLLGMINDILSLAKLEAGRLELNKKEFSLTGLLTEIAETFKARAELDGLSIHVESEEEVKLSADEKLIRRVIINLLGNALKYTPSGGRVTLRCYRECGVSFCAIEDTGEGIPAGMVDRIFDRFQQVEGRSRGGTGIGLNVSKEIVLAHGGKIWAESEEGEGSVFKFSIPDEKA